MGLNIDEQKAVDRFRKSVAEPSMTQLVILDFWAEWCGPCKALTPVLEKVAAEYADKGVLLAKVNVDEEQFIASQFQVRSIPTVYAIFQGQPVADLTNARTESQLKQTIDQLLEKLPVQPGGEAAKPDIAPLIAMGEEALASDPHVERARTALELAKNKPDDSELASLRSAAAERPDDMEAQLAFANAAFAAGERDDAAATLLRMVEADREWNEGAAKAKLLQIFEAVGLEDPWVSATRRKLSTILFG